MGTIFLQIGKNNYTHVSNLPYLNIAFKRTVSFLVKMILFSRIFFKFKKPLEKKMTVLERVNH